uniref:Uncharacterized protein n=1 Tax=Ditylenchus dipsaci TaxID=166011 RepID=A0A915EHH9_9BILA
MVGMEMLNKTVDVTQDLGTVISRMNGLRGICNQLFEKLRGTAEFLQNLLNNLEDSEEGRELLRKINEIKLDLDKSMHEARNLVDEVKKAEKSVSEFRGILQQTLNQTSEEYSQFQTDITQDNSFAAANDVNEAMKQEVERLKAVEEQYESLRSL